MAGGEPRMTGDCCWPEGSIHRCVRTHSHLYSYIYGLVALLDNIQSSFSKYYYFEQYLLACELKEQTVESNKEERRSHIVCQYKQRNRQAYIQR